MNDRDRLVVFSRLQQQELQMIGTKGREYSLGAEQENEKDSLGNFYRVGEMVQVTCPQCHHMFSIGAMATAMVYKLKHVFAILTAAANPFREMSEPFESRIVDDRTYDGLIQCIYERELANAAQPQHSKESMGDFLLPPDEPAQPSEPDVIDVEPTDEYRDDASPTETTGSASEDEPQG